MLHVKIPMVLTHVYVTMDTPATARIVPVRKSEKSKLNYHGFFSVKDQSTIDFDSENFNSS